MHASREVGSSLHRAADDTVATGAFVPVRAWHSVLLAVDSGFRRELRLDTYDDMRSMHRFSFEDSRGSCYRKRLTAEDGVLTEIKLAGGCPGNRKQVRVFARPDGSPGSMGWAE